MSEATGLKVALVGVNTSLWSSGDCTCGAVLGREPVGCDGVIMLSRMALPAMASGV